MSRKNMDHAKKNKLPLVKISIDKRFCDPKGGSVSLDGTCNLKTAKRLTKLIISIARGEA